jgi:hypothetical protein
LQQLAPPIITEQGQADYGLLFMKRRWLAAAAAREPCMAAVRHVSQLAALPASASGIRTALQQTNTGHAAAGPLVVGANVAPLFKMLLVWIAHLRCRLHWRDLLVS